jgi:transposase
VKPPLSRYGGGLGLRFVLPDEVRRQEFFRCGDARLWSGKRWLLLRRWKTVRGSKRQELQQRFAASDCSRRTCSASSLIVWTYKTREGVARFLFGWLKALRWQRLPEMERLGDTLVNHFDGIAAFCDHPVRFGVVESLNTTIKGVRRRARGMRDETMLLLKLKWATVRPGRSSRDLVKLLQPIRFNS